MNGLIFAAEILIINQKGNIVSTTYVYNYK